MHTADKHINGVQNQTTPTHQLHVDCETKKIVHGKTVLSVCNLTMCVFTFTITSYRVSLDHLFIYLK